MPPTKAAGFNVPQTPIKKRKPRLIDDDHPNVKPEPETPQKVSHDLDAYIEHLNTTWNLNLPRLRGASASQMESASALAKRCSARLRYLCFRAESLDSLIVDFEDRARLIHADWKFKPQADHDLFVRRNASDSALSRAVIKGKMPTLNDNQVSALLKCLDGVLEDPYELARTNDSFNMTSAASVSGSVKVTVAPSTISGPEIKRTRSAATSSITCSTPEFKKPNMGSKRASTSSDISDKPKKVKTSKNILTNYFSAAITPQTSFETNPSPTPSAIWSAAGDESHLSSSTDTLPLEDLDQPHADHNFPPTQDGEEFLEDAGVIKSLEEVSHTSTPRTLFDRLEDTFDDHKLRLPSNIDHDFAYELHSHAFESGQPAMALFICVRNICQTESPGLMDRISAYRTPQYRELMGEAVPALEVFSASSWQQSENEMAQDPLRSVYQSLTLTFDQKTSRDKSPFSVHLHAPHKDKSCRFHRHYGGRRFIQLNLPFLEKGNLGDTNEADAHSAIVRWLTEGNIRFAGRRWKPFWVEDRPKSKDGEWYNNIHLFAVTGNHLLEPISIKDFMGWHIPWLDNLNSTDHKVFARFKLGLSKTIPTVVLQRAEFVDAPDMMSSTGVVMNDGCALMSAELGKAIADVLGLDYVPSAFQGRIAGAKGLWLVDQRNTPGPNIKGRKFWIQITASQLKIKPHPCQRDAPDIIRTFEVTEYSKTLQQSALNSQLLNVLYNRGVRRELLAARLQASSKAFYDELCDGIQEEDALRLRYWLQKHYNYGSTRFGDISFIGSRPVNKTDQARILLDAGFTPLTPYLHELLTDCLPVHMNDFVERMRIELPKSTVAYIVADPYGVLNEGEVQLCLSGTWTDPDTKTEYTTVNGMDGLVARNPANHPRDMQRVRFVYRPELGNYTNVMFFSTKGDRPLADFLSGGDYDGDRAFACWDQALVSDFVNYPESSHEEVSPSDVGITVCATSMSTIFPNGEINSSSVNNFITKCLDFTMKPSCLGIVTNQLVSLVYHESIGRSPMNGRHALQSRAAMKLAALASFLVDRAKQSYHLSTSAWNLVRKECCGSFSREKPAFQKSEDKVGEKDGKDFNTANINDYLRFQIARAEKDRIMKNWAESFKPCPKRDDALLRPFNKYELRASRDPTVSEIIKRLKAEVKDLYEEYKRRTVRKNTAILLQATGEIHQKFLKIQPFIVEGQEAHSFYEALELSEDASIPIWPVIRACYIYREYHKQRFAWAMAADELCRLKAQSVGRSVTVNIRQYGASKIDGKIVKRIAEAGSQRFEEVAADEDNAGSAQDEETQYFDAQSVIHGPIDEYFFH